MQVKEMAKTVLKELENVFSRFDYAQLDSFEEAISSANMIVVAGVGREGLAAKAFTMRLMHLGKESHWVWDDSTPSLSTGDLFIATNGCGNIGHINYLMKRAKEAGAKVIVITGDPNGAGVEIADEVIFIPAAVYLGNADVVKSIQPMGNLFEQSALILFDLIIMDMQEKFEVDPSAMSGRHRNIE